MVVTVKILQDCAAGGETLKVGDVVEIDEGMAEALEVLNCAQRTHTKLPQAKVAEPEAVEPAVVEDAPEVEEEAVEEEPEPEAEV